jgi:hypothetical protein
MYESHARIADAATVVSAMGAAASVAMEALPIVQLMAGLIAIVAGIFAIVYHYKKIQSMDD